ncbi:unnamed protein product [Bursaphelenchus okinawaensis]|uniref:Uncharacterized protein n=1 Tax=Bursaphelenchus okinawaensis TaxID=465554 RepID=A0A811KHY4_9BILA|nr:unnamed protein product [Bursaphelenchus okinawaensis]CAG9103441.1 unnamed protein product [Bursaphelenchus okinawaensis]
MWVLYSTTASLVFAISILAYTAIVILVYLILKACNPDMFANTSDNEIEGLQYGEPSFANCSFLYKCFPCSTCSFRSCWRNVLPTKSFSLRQLANCECIRPTIHGNSPYRVDLICCKV